MVGPESGPATWKLYSLESAMRFTGGVCVALLVGGAGLAAEKSKQPKKAVAFYDQLLKVCSIARSSRPELAHAQAYLAAVAGTN